MSATVSEAYGLAVAGEVRAWMGRRGMRQRALAEAIGKDDVWVSRRVNGKVPMTVEDLAMIAQALNCGVADLLPRLDSNQQPSGYPSLQVSESDELGAAA